MKRFLLILLGCAVAVGLAGVFMVFRRRRARRRHDREQMDRKLQEDALDRALANRHAREMEACPQAPVAMRYDAAPAGSQSGGMLRITWVADPVRKEYLFPMGKPVFLGQEHGRTAVFAGSMAPQGVFCEIFQGAQGIYARRFNRPVELVRGHHRAGLDAAGILLRSGDRLETPQGVFWIEFL